MKKTNRIILFAFFDILVVKRNTKTNLSVYFVTERTKKRDRNVKCGQTTGSAAYYDQY